MQTQYTNKYKLDNKGSYQITASAAGTGRKAVITKFNNENVWSVALFKENDTVTKASYVERGHKTLRMAKCVAETFVEGL